MTSLSEDRDTSSRIKVADIVVTDDGVGTNDLSLICTDSALFEIDGMVLYLKAGTVLDHETNPVLDVNVEVNDATVGANPDDRTALAITVTDVNEAPTVALAKTSTSLSEKTDTSSRIKVADIIVRDDALGTNDLSLSGADAALFEIDGAVLYLKAGVALNHDINPVLDVTVEVNDPSVGIDPDDTAVLSISVTETALGQLTIEDWWIKHRAPGRDDTRIAGRFDVSLETIRNADTIQVRLLGVDGSEVLIELIDVDPADFETGSREGVYTHWGSWTGGVVLLQLDTRRQEFVFVARTDLSSLIQPFTLEITVGDYVGSDQA